MRVYFGTYGTSKVIENELVFDNLLPDDVIVAKDKDTFDELNGLLLLDNRSDIKVVMKNDSNTYRIKSGGSMLFSTESYKKSTVDLLNVTLHF